MTQKANMPLFGVMLALGMVGSTFLVTEAMRDVRLSHQIIKVRGYAETTVESNWVEWVIKFSAVSKDIKAGYSSIDQHKEKILKFLRDNELSNEEIKLKSVDVQERMRRTEKGVDTHELEAYVFTQSIEIGSEDVYKIEKLATDITKLMEQGVVLTSGTPAYYYSKVNDLKSRLLTDATRDAKIRAQTLAVGSGVKLGLLRAARQGSFSIRSGKSSTISDDGGYDDTGSIVKKVTAVVTVDYSMK